MATLPITTIIVLVESWSEDYDWLALTPGTDRGFIRLSEEAADELRELFVNEVESLRPSGRKVITLTA